MIDRDVIGYFGCPEAYGTCQVDGPGEPGAGYFRFGDAVRFEESSVSFAGDVTETSEYDASLRAKQTSVTVSRLPGEIARNLRLEQYVEKPSQHGWRVRWHGLQRQAYYSVRPFLGISTRKYLQRRALRGWNKIPFPRWPVDRTVDAVFENFLERSIKANGVNRVPFIWFWPDGHQSCCIMTHDVETAAGVKACDALMDLDSSFGLAASFQLVPEGRYTVSEQFLNRVRSRRFEVNVHDLNHDGHLYDDREEFLRRAERINHYVEQYGARGFRSAVLYRNVTWYDAFKFSYDMSVPNVAHLDPQRGGCCTVTPYFIGDIVELPLTTIQDYSLFNILRDYSVTLWKTQVDYIIQNHGLLSFNVHPDYLATTRAQNTYSTLLHLLARVRSEGLTFFALPGEVERWWRQRSQMRLVLESGQWRIIGAGNERAVIAYASVGPDGLSYSIGR